MRDLRQDDPRRFLRNTYRVNLTRDGDLRQVQTEVALFAAGLKPLPVPVEFASQLAGAGGGVA